jgi:hypothetical protein
MVGILEDDSRVGQLEKGKIRNRTRIVNDLD